jgi:hemolysin activation/secretion protein
MILILAVAFFSMSAQALTPAQIVQQQKMIQQQQEQQRQMEQNRQEIQEAKRIRKAREEEGVLPKTAEPAPGMISSEEPDTCPRLDKVEVSGNRIFSNRFLDEQIFKKYQGKCLNRANMAALQNEIMALYVDKGYTLARVYFDLKKMNLIGNEKTLFIVIEEGKVDRVYMDETIEGEKKAISAARQKQLRRQAFFAFPFAEGNTFNLRDFEQGLDQMNRLQSNNATMDIKPGRDIHKAGYSDIHITNNRQKRTTFFSFDLDNTGTRSTGQNMASVSVNQDNLFDVNDNIYLKYSQDIMFDRDKRYNQLFYGNVSVPFGYWTLNASLNYSKYKSTVNGMYTSFHLTGDTLTGTASIDRVLWRNKFFKTNLGVGLEVKDVKSYVRDVKSQVGSRLASNYNIYWNNIIYTPMGTLILKPSYERGLDWFGSKEDPDDILKTEPHLQYDMVKLYGYYNTQINIPMLTTTKGVDQSGEEVEVRDKLPITYTLSFDSQYSFNPLYGTNQFSVGGLYTVRGFKEGNISGDSGYYIRNDVRVSTRHLLPESVLKADFMNWGAEEEMSLAQALARTYLSVFYDYGFVKNKYDWTGDIYNSQSGYMSGTGAGLNYYGKYLNWSLSYAFALHSPDYMQTRDGVKKEKHNVYWRASVNF